ncbi:MAG: hypothetical protein NVS2B7_34930 [Herpetosiphon sp.]
MNNQRLRRVIVTLLLVSVVFPGVIFAREQGATLVASGTMTTVVDGRSIPGVQQREHLQISGDGFVAGERIGVWVTLQDFSVFGVDHDAVRANNAGHWTIDISLGAQLPVGVHQVSARGKTSGLGAVVPFALRPGEGPAPTGDGTLTVMPTIVRQQATITLTAAGFRSDERIALWLTQPDGVVLDLGQIALGPNGTLATSLILSSDLPVGPYAVTAQGGKSGMTAIARFVLQYGNGLPVAGARLSVNLGRAVQRMILNITAGGFTPGESIALWQTLPNGAVIDRGEVHADTDGKLATTIALSEALPAGIHYLSFRSNTSEQFGFARIYLAPGPRMPGVE